MINSILTALFIFIGIIFVATYARYKLRQSSRLYISKNFYYKNGVNKSTGSKKNV